MLGTSDAYLHLSARPRSGHPLQNHDIAPRSVFIVWDHGGSRLEPAYEFIQRIGRRPFSHSGMRRWHGRLNDIAGKPLLPRGDCKLLGVEHYDQFCRTVAFIDHERR